MNTYDTDTDTVTQDNTPCGSYNEKEEENQFLKTYLAQQKSLKNLHKEKNSLEEEEEEEDKDVIYHVNPKGVIEVNPDLIGKVKQAYLFCQQCREWKHLTTDNSIQLPFGEFSFQKQHYIGGFCWTRECNQMQYEKEQNQKTNEIFWTQEHALRHQYDEFEELSNK
jgi:hypothetical protein